MCHIIVPSGTYLISSEIDTGGREVLWDLDQGAIVNGYEYLNGKVFRLGQRQGDAHHGTTDYACSYSVRANEDLEKGAGVVGITTEAGLVSYVDRDTVAFFASNTAPAPVINAATASYTANTVTITAPSSAKVKRLRRGMIIDTKHDPKWSAFVESWNDDGSVITVNNWYRVGDGGTPSTPTDDGTGCVIGAFTKAWAHNANITINGDSWATGSTGFELGVLNNKGALDFANRTNYVVGYDAVSLGAHDGGVGFIARKSSSSKFYRAFVAEDATQVGFYCSGTPVNGFWSEQSSGAPFKYSPGGVTKFEVTGSGNVSLTATSANLSLGNLSASNTPFIDFNSSGNAIDYDARFLASGGTGVSGNAAITCYAGAGFITTGSVRPATDNVVANGASTFRWTNTFSTNFRPGAGTATWTAGAGTPEGNVTAVVGSMYTRTDGGANTTLYVKESGTGNTGWVAK